MEGEVPASVPSRVSDRLFLLPFAVTLLAASMGGHLLYDLARFAAHTDRSTLRPAPRLARIGELVRGRGTVMMVSDHPRALDRAREVQRAVTPVAVQPLPDRDDLLATRLGRGEPLVLDLGVPARGEAILALLAARGIAVTVTRIDERLLVIVPVG